MRGCFAAFPHAARPLAWIHTRAPPPCNRAQVVGASIALAVLSFPFARWAYIKHWQRMTQRELFEQKMLRRGQGGGVVQHAGTRLAGARR